MRISLTDAPEPTDREVILSGLVGYNEAHAGPREWRPLALMLHDDEDRPPAGSGAERATDGCSLRCCSCPRRRAVRGLGPSSSGGAEAEARNRGCVGVWLDTYEFQAEASTNGSATACSVRSTTIRLVPSATS
jgi:hypothetical protein